jgi:hypothetical protein
MSNTLSAGPHALREALYELTLTQEVPDARVLDEIVRRYPRLGDELTDYAIALALDALRDRHGADVEPAADPKAVSPAVERAMKRLKSRLAARHGKTSARAAAGTAPPPRRAADAPAADVSNPFASLNRPAFRALADRLHANPVFLCKLRDRQIDPDTIPGAFQSRIAAELEVPLELVQAHFHAQQSIHAGQRFKADGKPAIGAQQSFEEAVRSSNLTPDQQKALLTP